MCETYGKFGEGDFYGRSANESEAGAQLIRLLRDIESGIVFSLLEGISILGFVANVLLALVILRYRHWQKPSYVLILSLAAADLMHSLVSFCYFYPPIVLPFFCDWWAKPVSKTFGTFDWTAWGVTLIHMAALTVDRFTAILLCHTYKRLFTIKRLIVLASVIWAAFLAINVFLAIADYCCMIIPMPKMYTFGFWETTDEINVYARIYVPIEVTTMVLVGLVNPLTLFYFWRVQNKLKRQTSHVADKSGSSPQSRTLLLRKSGSSIDPHSTPSPSIGRSRREAKIYVQICIIVFVFFIYMLIYYLCFYILNVSSRWPSLLNSLFYCCNAIIHPIVYFTFNKQLKGQLKVCEQSRNVPAIILLIIACVGALIIKATLYECLCRTTSANKSAVLATNSSGGGNNNDNNSPATGAVVPSSLENRKTLQVLDTDVML